LTFFFDRSGRVLGRFALGRLLIEALLQVCQLLLQLIGLGLRLFLQLLQFRCLLRGVFLSRIQLSQSFDVGVLGYTSYLSVRWRIAE